MKLVTMNALRRELRRQLRESWRCTAGSAELVRVQVASLDEGHQPGRDGGEDDRRERDRAEQQPVREEVAPLLDEDRPRRIRSHQSTSRSLRATSRSPVSRPAAGRPPRGWPPPRARPRCARLATSARTSSGLSRARIVDLDQQRPVVLARAEHERQRHQASSKLGLARAGELDADGRRAP